MYKTKHNFFSIFRNTACNNRRFIQAVQMKMFFKLCKRDLKFKVRVKVNKQNCIYATHLTFRVYY